MVQRVTLDAMIPREDFGREEPQQFDLDLFQVMPIDHLSKDNAILKLLRKPDFQRETNHWTPEQVVTFVASFLDNEVVPSLILWKSPSFIFVIDGGHRLSALRAWMEDDYGDKSISGIFYNSQLSEDQKKIAQKTRKLIESKIGRFSDLKALVGGKVGTDEQKRRSNKLFTRTLAVQWIQGSASVAETSFFKINTQGTPLDEIEEMLIRNRRKPIAICARAILRAGAGHEYWSAFSDDKKSELKELASEFYNQMFEPEVEEPLKTLEVSLGGSVSPVDALALLIEFLQIAGTRNTNGKPLKDYADDETGDETIAVLKNSLEIVRCITGHTGESLGLHPAVYFYSERGKYSRFLFLGMSLLIAEKVRNNDRAYFKKFISKRQKLETFLIENKSLIAIILQNMSKTQRVPKIRDMLQFLLSELSATKMVSPEELMTHLGLEGRVFDVVAAHTSPHVSDDTKSKVFLTKALATALTCPICQGKLDPKKSVSYDHRTRVRAGGLGNSENVDLVHPFCNTGVKN